MIKIKSQREIELLREAGHIVYQTHQYLKPYIKEGMVIAVEPMLNLGTADIYMLDDGWTILTDDDSPSAHFEHTVVVTKDGYEILTGE